MRRSLLLFLLCLFNWGFGQEQLNGFAIGVRPEVGTIIPHRVLMNHLVQGRTKGVNVHFLKQTDGEKTWHHSYNFPKLGGGVYATDFGHDEVLGVGIGGYGVLYLPVVRYKRWGLSGKTGAGIAYVSKIFDQERNPKNNVISSHINSLIMLGLEVERRLDVGALNLSANLTHFSNGAAKMPNLGINLATVSLGYLHYLNPITFDERLKNKELQAEYDSSLSGYVFGVFSHRETYPTGGRSYPIGSLSFLLQKQLSPKLGVETYLDLFYNTANRTHLETPSIALGEILQVGVYSGVYLPVGKVSLLTGMGVYLRNNFKNFGAFYHRFGMRYQFTERWMGNLTIKAHWGRADYFEYGIAYKLF